MKKEPPNIERKPHSEVPGEAHPLCLWDFRRSDPQSTGDVEKELVKQFSVAGYPTGIMLDAAGKEIRRFVGYQSSKETLDWITSGGAAKK